MRDPGGEWEGNLEEELFRGQLRCCPVLGVEITGLLGIQPELKVLMDKRPFQWCA